MLLDPLMGCNGPYDPSPPTPHHRLPILSQGPMLVCCTVLCCLQVISYPLNPVSESFNSVLGNVIEIILLCPILLTQESYNNALVSVIKCPMPP